MADKATLRAGLHLENSAEDHEIIAECLQICSDYNIPPEDLQYRWEAFAIQNPKPTAIGNFAPSMRLIDLDGAKAFRAAIARDVARVNQGTGARGARGGARGRGYAATAGARMKAGINVVPTRPAATAATSSANGLARSAPSTKLSVKYIGPDSEAISKRNYRYMFEKVSRRSHVLDERIDEFGEIIREKYGVEELGDPSSATEDLVTVVGRLCLDHETDSNSPSSKPTATNLVLEASRFGGSGERIPLKFEPDFKIHGASDSTSGKSLFTGEILALRGKNGGGGWFLVQEVLPVPLTSPSSKAPTQAFSVSIASGPYTSELNLDYTPFQSIIDEAKNTKPSVLILLGPFIDSGHPMVKSAKIPLPPSALFQQYFVKPIQSLLQQNSDTLVLIVPHVRDILCSNAVFPQGTGSGDFGTLPSAVRVIPNPSIFSLNGISFGVSTVDVLYHLKNQQYIQRPQHPTGAPTASLPPDAMANLCRHVLEQRSFYPLFPVPVELSADVNLDVSHSEFLHLSEPAPDVLILPSILRQFTKSVEGTLIINTSSFGKSRILGRIDIPTSPSDRAVCDYAKVDLKKLA
ncbi:hypothetical protein M422DRAFT_200787 [Sphaerobolus stellatus SS14]|nr:hypothetical protein M422DRAFT_200787 [Sphaerobolus stellatus SS14]